MAMLILNTYESRRLLKRRRALGIDQPDEVWNGTYIVFPPHDNEHQELRAELLFVLYESLGKVADQHIYPGVNISDRRDAWRRNYRCPDVVVFLPGNPAEDCSSHYRGGPDFGVEIMSPRDWSRKKLGFYARVGTRELLLIGRKPWSLELHRLTEGELKLVGKLSPDPIASLNSQVLPLSFRLLPGDPRPTIEVTQTEDARQWLI